MHSNLSALTNMTFASFCLLLTSGILDFSKAVFPNDACSLRKDVKLRDDSTSRHAFLQCRPANRGNVGIWQWIPCPIGYEFKYENQSCLNGMIPTHINVTEKLNLKLAPVELSIKVLQPPSDLGHLKMPLEISNVETSFLNDSCKNGEQCSGGTICSIATGSCVCAPGSYNIPESKYCHYPMEAYYSTTTEITPDQQKENESVTEIGTGTIESPTTDAKYDSSACGSMDPSCPGNLICDLSNRQCVCPIGKHLITEDLCSGIMDESEARRSRQLYPSASKCRSNSDCTDGSFCNMLTMPSFCQCLSNYAAVKNRCLKAIYPGQFGCMSDLQCSTVHRGTFCHDNICTCPPGTHLIFLVCVPDHQRSSYANPGDRCDPQQQCLGGSFCFGRKCVCPDNSIVKHGRCDIDNQYENNYQIIAATPTTAPNYEQFNVEPLLGYSYLTASKFSPAIIKKMNENIKLNFEDRTTIVPDNMLEKLVLPGHLCDSKTNCAENALCVNGICRCFSNFQLRNGHCVRIEMNKLKFVSPNDPCKSDEICTGGSECSSDKICRCPPDTTLSNGLCLMDSPGIVSNTVTISYTVSPDVTSGLKEIFHHQSFAGPSNSCASGEKCVNGSMCNSQTLKCDCPDHMIVVDDRCVPRLQYETNSMDPAGNDVSMFAQRFGQPCNQSTDCIFGLECWHRVCTCPFATKFNVTSQRCYPNVQNIPHDRPSVSYSTLDDLGRQIPVGGRCLKHDFCLGDSQCIAGLCQCPINTIEIDHKCVNVERRVTSKSLKPGIFCKHDHQCSENSLCVGNACQCKDGFALKDDGCQSYALPKRHRSVPGDPCNDFSDCTGNSYCRLGYCVCPLGTESINMMCFPSIALFKSALPEQSCGSGQRCLGGSYCDGNACQCPQGYTAKKGFCLRESYQKVDGSNQPISTDDLSRSLDQSFSPEPGNPCIKGQSCVNGSVCAVGLCRCAAGLQQIGNKCFPEKNMLPPGHVCSYGQHCTGGSSCIVGFCQCRSSYVLKGGVCVYKNLRMLKPSREKSNDPTSPKLAKKCPLPENVSACQLPDCFCSKSGHVPPGNVSPDDTPQLIVLTFDDPINERTFSQFRQFFRYLEKSPNPLVNKNGCPIKGTFFVSHEWTDYDLVEWLYVNGHEIASNSITHSSLTDKSLKRWEAEMNGQRRILSNLSRISIDQITGMRAPQLALGGDTTFMMMKASLFTYDNSMTANPESHVPFWPTTLDYALPWRCQNWQCPKKSFPGLWEIPINQFLKYRNDAVFSKGQFSAKSSMISSLLDANDTFDDLLAIFEKNFKRAYNTNKAPYILTLNAEYFAFQGSSGEDENLPYEVLSQFLHKILHKPDVWIVTMQQLIEWLKNPTTVESLLDFRPFSCSGPNQKDNISCGLVNKCFYTLENSSTKVERSFTTCSTCPNKYPWLNFL